MTRHLRHRALHPSHALPAGAVVPMPPWLPAWRRGRPRKRPVGGLAKRLTDLTLACLALVLLAPVMMAIALLIRAAMGGPIVFAQQRVGLYGRPFTFYKFRTMCADADRVLERHLASSPEAAAEWREKNKLLDDPRVGRLGNVLRKSSLDELPQLFNVLRGDMSLVGPRPVVPAEFCRYGNYGREIYRARPGLTGIWQVSGRSRLTFRDRICMDLHYTRHWSFWLDLALLARTVPAVLSVGAAA